MPSCSTFKSYPDRFLGLQRPLCAVSYVDEAARSAPFEYRLFLETRRTSYLGQATLVPVVPLAHHICDPEMKLRLVDCYVESIWGRRVRRAVPERAAVQAQCGGMPELSVGEDERCDMALDRIRTVVRCEALTAGIMGGDRADESGGFE